MKCVNMLICERLYVCMYIFLPLQDLYLYCFPTPSLSLSLSLLFQIDLYCLINDGKKDEAQIIYDLKKELGFKDKYFENKINYLFGFIEKADDEISEKSILDFHLAHQTNPKFSFEPKTATKKLIWNYLSSHTLLNSFQILARSFGLF